MLNWMRMVNPILFLEDEGADDDYAV